MEKIWFEVKYNRRFDDCAGDEPETVQDGYEEGISEAVLSLPDNYSKDGTPVPLIFCAHGSGGRVCREEDAVVEAGENGLEDTGRTGEAARR